MRYTIAALLFLSSGCFSAAMRLRGSDGNLAYEASGLNRPEPMEAALADLTSAQADMVRAQARTIEANPELLFGWGGYGWRYGYGWGRYGRVDPSYYYPTIPSPVGIGSVGGQTALNTLEARAAKLEARASELEEIATNLSNRQEVLEEVLYMHVSGTGGGQ